MTTPMPEPSDEQIKEALVGQGYTPEAADVQVTFQRSMEGKDATVVIPVVLAALENVTTLLTPEAQLQVAGLMSEAAFRISQAAAQAAQPQGDESEQRTH